MADLDFISLEFEGKSIRSFNLYVVSNSGRYTAPLSPQFENRTTSVPGRPGLLYWGTDIGAQELNVTLATDGMTGTQLNDFKKLFIPGRVGNLTFAESFYKTYQVLLNQAPVLDFVPFVNYAGESLYKGEIELSLITLEPYATSTLHIYNTQLHGAKNPNRKESGLPVLTDFPANARIYHLAGGKRVSNRAETTTKATDVSTLYFYHAGNAPAPLNLQFTKTYTLSGSTAPKSNWVNITIGQAQLVKPKFLVDIEWTMQTVYTASADWGAKKLATLELLREELNGSTRSKLIALVNAMGTGLAYPTFTALLAEVRAHFFTNATYTFTINASTSQCGLVVTSGSTTYREDNAGQFNGKFLFLNQSGVLPVAAGHQTIAATTPLNNVEATFKNTYI